MGAKQKLHVLEFPYGKEIDKANNKLENLYTDEMMNKFDK